MALELSWRAGSMLLVLALSLPAPSGVAAQGRPARPRPPASAAQPAPPVDQPVSAFLGLARVFNELFASGSVSPVEAAGRRFDFDQLVSAVSGVGPLPPSRSLEELRAGFAGTTRVTVAADGRALARDDTAYRLHSLGYSTKEIADMLSGRITRQALDNAQKMLMLGWNAERVSNQLDREYQRLAEAKRRPPLGPGPARARDVAARAAARYGVSADLVRAVIGAESGWDGQARSRAGAIGLMQLMPGTAAELGVNPYDIEQNIDGGVRYLAALLASFGTIERALIAYNAGPGFARRLIRGDVALYGETRAYVRDVMRRMAR